MNPQQFPMRNPVDPALAAGLLAAAARPKALQQAIQDSDKMRAQQQLVVLLAAQLPTRPKFLGPLPDEEAEQPEVLAVAPDLAPPTSAYAEVAVAPPTEAAAVEAPLLAAPAARPQVPPEATPEAAAAPATQPAVTAADETSELAVAMATEAPAVLPEVAGETYQPAAQAMEEPVAASQAAPNQPNSLLLFMQSAAGGGVFLALVVGIAVALGLLVSWVAALAWGVLVAGGLVYFVRLAARQPKAKLPATNEDAR